MLAPRVLLLGVILGSPAVAPAATFTVNTTADLADTNAGDGVCLTAGGNCSLRAAVEEANAAPDMDTIAFNLPGPGVHTFQTATLPSVTSPVVVDGFTQPGAQPNTNPTGGLNAVLRIELAGGLWLQGGDSTVRGVVANSGTLTFLLSANNVVEGCYIGTDATGTLDRSSLSGVAFTAGGAGSRVGGTVASQRNLVSGNTIGVYFQAEEGSIEGNLIGTDVTGTSALPNDYGVFLVSDRATIGGAAPAAGNVISGSTDAAIHVAGRGQVAILVENNLIGVDATGSQAIPNTAGIVAFRFCFPPTCSNQGPNVIVGGAAGRGNLIAHNGVAVSQSAGSCVVSHNTLRDNVTGVSFVAEPGFAFVGTIVENTIEAGLGDGIDLDAVSGSPTVTIAGNAVRGQGGSGVRVRGAFHARLTDNSIEGNGLLGIDLGGDGVTPNDILDLDTGPNGLMNHPVLAAAACAGGGSVTVSGTLHTTPNTTATIELFRSAACDPTTFGEGAVRAATTAVTTDAAGNASFSAPLTATAGEWITATAADTSGDSSEFSRCLRVESPPPAQVISGPAAVCEGSPFTLRAVAGAVAYQWLLDGTPIPGAIGPAYARSAATTGDGGTYTVRASGCGVDATSAPHALAVSPCAAPPAVLRVDEHALPGTVSDLNGVLEPAEASAVEPRYRNTTAAPLALTGSATLSGPSGGTYTLPDPAADHGTTAPGQLTDCFAATGNCYVAAVAAPTRPSAHWDATFSETTSGGDPTTQWLLHVGDTFADVPRGDAFYRFVETIVHNSITAGCSATDYCPSAGTQRDQMAVFVLIAKEGPSYRPPDCDPAAPRFTDVPASSPYCRWIEELARRQVVTGCTAGTYCPLASVTREQMSVFVLATREAPGYTPPACVAGTERFADVPASSPFCRWVEELHRRGVVAGCTATNYCPARAITRGEMSVFLTVTFGLQLYGP